MKKILKFMSYAASLIILLSIAHADEIYLNDGNIIKGNIKSISPSNIEYSTSKDKSDNVSTLDVKKLVYENGTVIKIKHKKSQEENQVETIPDDVGNLSEDIRKSPRIVWKTETESLYLPLLLRLAFQMNQGTTSVKIFDRDEEEIADGEADFTQYDCKISYEPVETEFYLSPELGYFYRQVKVKDYSYSVEKENTGIQGFIPGVVTYPSTGEIISKDSVSSLGYKASFHSFFLDLKTGYNFVTGFGPINLILNPYISLNLIEYRKSTFEFSFYNSNEKFSRPYIFSYLSSYGTGLELGIFFPGLRFGIKAGYDLRYFRRFTIADGVVFKEAYEDEELGLMRTRENSAKYTEIKADLFTLNVFFFI